MSKKLRCINLSPKLVQILTNNKIYTCREALNFTPIELMFLIKTDLKTAKEVISKASRVSTPKPTTALALYNGMVHSHLSTTLTPLDDVMHGGLTRGAITEIGGPPGCGKTQFCFLMTINQLLKDQNNSNNISSNSTNNNNNSNIYSNNNNINNDNSNNNNNNNRSVVYIDTEGAFDIERIIEMAMMRFPEEFEEEERLVEEVVKGVMVVTVTTLQGLIDRLERIEEMVIKERVGLVILDSVASLFKREFNCQLKGNVFERNKLLTNVASILKILAHNYQLVVIVTNQITTKYNVISNDFEKNKNITYKNDYNNIYNNKNNNKDTRDINGEFNIKNQDSLFIDKIDEESTDSWEESRVTVALGIQWSHCVNCKFLVQYTDHERIRELYLVKSPQSPIVKFLYTTEAWGIQLQSGPVYEDDNFNYKSVKTKSGLSLN